MVIHNNDMIILGIIKAFLKISLFWFGTVALFQNMVNDDIVEKILSTVPSQVLMFCGFCYVVFIVIRKGHDTYTHVQLNRMKIKREAEVLKQDQIHTQSDEKDLNNE